MESQSNVVRRRSTEIKLGPPIPVSRRSHEILFVGRRPRVIPWLPFGRNKPCEIAHEVSSVQPRAMEPTKACHTDASASLPEHHEVLSLISQLHSLLALIPPFCLNAQASIPISDVKVEKPKRKYAKRKTDRVVEEIPLPQRKWISIKQAAAIYPQSEQAFRHLTRQAEQYQKYPKAGLPSNGFENCIVRQPGSRNIYLNAEELELWMARGQGGAQ